MPKLKFLKAISLMELLVTMVLLAFIVIGIGSIHVFGRYQILTANRRAELQNNVSLCLEHMSKSVVKGIGNRSVPAIQQIIWFDALGGFVFGFSVLQDTNADGNANTSTDRIVFYVLDGNAIKYYRVNPDSSLYSETLAERFLSGVQYTSLPVNPDKGFYINITDNGSAVELALVSRYEPDEPQSSSNPQVVMKTKIYARAASAM